MIEVEQATFGAGCFWGAEAVFRKLPGVIDTRVGFATGTGPDAARIEVVQVDFSPETLTFDGLIEHFWGLHDPTSLDRQADTARDAISKLDGSGRLARPVATVILSLGHFELAKEDDQRYLERHGLASCSL
jgi:peptide-methionine (S)-S-oxide reductase